MRKDKTKIDFSLESKRKVQVYLKYFGYYFLRGLINPGETR